MLVARAQLNFIADLIARFAYNDGVMRPVVDYQSQYVAIIALLRSVGHVFEKVDCIALDRRNWCKAQWPSWKQEAIFREFIEPSRNALLKEFQGGLQLHDGGFPHTAAVFDPSTPGGVSMVAAFNASEVRDSIGKPVLPQLYAAVEFWDHRLREAEVTFGEAPASTSLPPKHSF